MKLQNHSKTQYYIHGKRTGKQTSDSISTEVFSYLNACHSAKEKKVKHFIDFCFSWAKSLEWFTTPSFCDFYTSIVCFLNGNITKIKLA